MLLAQALMLAATPDESVGLELPGFASGVDVAPELFLSLRTVKGHLQRACTTLGIIDHRMLVPSPSQ